MGTAEKLTKTKMIMPNQCFFHIVAKGALIHPMSKETQEAAKLVSKQYGYNKKSFIDTVCLNIVLIKSVCEN